MLGCMFVFCSEKRSYWKGVYLMPEEFVRSQELATSHVDALVGRRWRTLAVVANRIVLSVRGVKAELLSL